MPPEFEGKAFKSITRGSADLNTVCKDRGGATQSQEVSAEVESFIAFAKETLADQVSDVRSSDRLTEDSVCPSSHPSRAK